MAKRSPMDEKAFNSAWTKLGPALLDALDKANAIDEAWDIDREMALDYIRDQAAELSEADLWVFVMILGTLADATKAALAESKPSNVVSLMDALKKKPRREHERD